MPNRIIKESTFSSDKIAQLSDFAFRLWVGLIVNADDAGRGDARPAIIKGHIFALRERVTVKEINDALRILAAHNCVSLYTVGGKPFYEFPNWAKHQRIRDCKPRYPGSDEADDSNLTSCGELPQSAASCGELRRVAAVCGELPPKSESNPNPNPNTNTSSCAPAQSDFDRFWSVYPRHEKKKDAERAFAKALSTHKGLTVDAVVAAVEEQKRSRQWMEDGGRYIPHPATWLNGEQWENEVQTSTAKEGSARRETVSDDEIKRLEAIYAAVKGE